MAAEQADTIVGVNVELKGSLHNQGAIQIHGTVTGDIVSSSQVVIGETAIVTGPITAQHVEVSGKVYGTITAEGQIELHPKSLVKGDLITNRLSIKPGAVFIGKSQMTDTGDGEQPEEKKKPKLEIE